MRQVKYLFETIAFLLVMGFFRLLPLDTASWLGGRLFRWLGPKMKICGVARTNISFAFPDMNEEDKNALVRRHFEHLGRVISEFAHLSGNDLLKRVSARGLTNFPSEDKGAIFISGHIGNWELLAPVAYGYGTPIRLVYRHANNPLVDMLIRRMRSHHCEDLIPKGMRGAAKMAKALKAKQPIAMLVDQKMNEGMPVTFFGKEAMTATAVAQLALKFDIPIIPARCVRTEGAHFKAEAFPALQFEKTGNDEDDVRVILEKINALLENWIREYPEQWLWTHRRFDKTEYQNFPLPFNPVTSLAA